VGYYDKIKCLNGIEIFDVIKSEKNKYTCFVKLKIPDDYSSLVKKFDLDLIWDTPTIITEDKLVISVIGDKDGLKRFLEAVKMLGEIRNIKYRESAFQGYNILSCLTDRQRDIIFEAKRSGYYNYPRKISGDQLSQRMGISKATTIEHLRKAEARIMSNMLREY
jgi:predicted DNA binding protein